MTEAISPTQAVLAVYVAMRDSDQLRQDDWDIEMALLDEWISTFELYIEFAETDEEEQRSREAIDTALGLKRAIMAVAATPGAEGYSPMPE